MTYCYRRGATLAERLWWSGLMSNFDFVILSMKRLGYLCLGGLFLTHGFQMLSGMA